MVIPNSISYEEVRRKRLEENKRRMEELNLTKLVQEVRNASSTKPSLMKRGRARGVQNKQKEMVPTEVRRSSRISVLPTPVYKEVKPVKPLIIKEKKQVKPFPVYEELDLTNVRRSSRLSTVPAPVYNEDSFDDVKSPGRYSIYDDDEDRMNALEQAEELQSKLESGFPSFVRPILPRHLTGSFWLGLPSSFCKTNLPHRDETITLIDEDGDNWQTIYIAIKTGLTGGWREFALDHKLVDGDALVFELIKPTEFKVYIGKVERNDTKVEE